MAYLPEGGTIDSPSPVALGQTDAQPHDGTSVVAAAAGAGEGQVAYLPEGGTTDTVEGHTAALAQTAEQPDDSSDADEGATYSNEWSPSVNNAITVSSNEDEDVEDMDKHGVEVISSKENAVAATEEASNRSAIADVPVYAGGNFREVWDASMAVPLKIIEGQFRQLTWAGKEVKVQSPATSVEVRAVLPWPSLSFVVVCLSYRDTDMVLLFVYYRCKRCSKFYR